MVFGSCEQLPKDGGYNHNGCCNQDAENVFASSVTYDAEHKGSNEQQGAANQDKVEERTHQSEDCFFPERQFLFACLNQRLLS